MQVRKIKYTHITHFVGSAHVIISQNFNTCCLLTRKLLGNGFILMMYNVITTGLNITWKYSVASGKFKSDLAPLTKIAQKKNLNPWRSSTIKARDTLGDKCPATRVDSDVG